MRDAENFLRQNQKLHSGIGEVARLRDDLDRLALDDVRCSLDRALAFFRHELGPHARAEERVFYPAVARVLGVDLGDRLVGEHRLISAKVDELSELRHRVVADQRVPEELHDTVTTLVAMVEEHFRLEAEVFQRMLECDLSDAEAYFLYEHMEEASFDAVVELSAPHETTGPS